VGSVTDLPVPFVREFGVHLPIIQMAETVTFEECANGLAIITIDRPKALNAANVKMVQELREGIAKCKSSSVKAVLFQGAGGSCFCSGGDVKGLHGELKKDPETQVPKEQIFQEYNAIYEIKQLAIPTVALTHGVTMGFGLGTGVSATYRIATEKSRFAMPENNIGLFPDACFPYIAANNMPVGIGRLMALTGCHLIGAGDVLAAKLATHFVGAEKMPSLVDALKSLDLGDDAMVTVQGCIDGFAEEAPAPKLLVPDNPLPAKLAAAGSVAEAVAAIKADTAGADLMKAMESGCPFSQSVVWELLLRAEADVSAEIAEPGRLAAALERDFAVGCRMLYRADFVEGVRAVLVDKDKSPKWQPPSLEDVSAEEVTSTLAPLPDGERTLGVPLP